MKVFEILDPTKMFGGFNLSGIADIGNPLNMLKPNAKGEVEPNANGEVEPEATNEVVIIGDSIAVGMGGSEPYAKGGISTAEVLNRVNAFIKTGKAKGAVVILSSGASNSAPIELEGGTTQSGNLSPVAQQLAVLKAAGASVALVGTGSKKSAWFPPTKYTNGKRYRIDLTGVNQQLSSMASSNGAKFLGPLEEYDSGMHSGKGDGVHPFGAYQKLKQSGSAIFPSKQPATTPSKQPSNKKIPSTGGKGSVNPNDIKSYLSSKGLSKNHVAGIMANIKAESRFRPGAIGDNGTSGGLFQHHKQRFAAMTASAGKNWATNWKGQIDFALSEPAGRQYVAMKFSSPEAASKWFTINFERPANMVAKANSRSADAASYA
jgi:hypothetical protein